MGECDKAKEEPIHRPAAFLEVSLTLPRMHGLGGPAWPRSCTIYVGIGGELVDWQKLPFVFDKDEFREWNLGLRIPVSWDWPRLSLDIFVERADCLFRRRTNSVVVNRGGPHTSRHTAVIGRARVRLLDALVLGDLLDDDDDEQEQEMKRRRRNEVEGNPRLLEGTMPLGKTVQLLDWESSLAHGDEYGNSRPVVRGAVDVRMILMKPSFFR